LTQHFQSDGVTAVRAATSKTTPLLVAAARGQLPLFAHCRRMTDHIGIVQFARGAQPDLDFGYCLDDNARAFLVSLTALSLDPKLHDARVIGETALGFMEKCRRSDGRFHNLMAQDGSFTDEVGSSDSLGRMVWACGIAAACAPQASWRERAARLLESALDIHDTLLHLMPRSYAILGLAAATAPDKASPIPATRNVLEAATRKRALQILEKFCSALVLEFERNASADWQWFAPRLTWGNARIPEALLRGAAAANRPDWQDIGMKALTFLASITQPESTFIPIGNHGWFERGGERAVYDQQPIEACAMVDAWLAAAALTDKLEYEGKALEAFSWFLGLNTGRTPVVEPSSGGCHDGLKPSEVNANMGAESTLSYLQAHANLAAAFRRKYQ
jgi:hypothetical protein